MDVKRELMSPLSDLTLDSEHNLELITDPLDDITQRIRDCLLSYSKNLDRILVPASLRSPSRFTLNDLLGRPEVWHVITYDRYYKMRVFLRWSPRLTRREAWDFVRWLRHSVPVGLKFEVVGVWGKDRP